MNLPGSFWVPQDGGKPSPPSQDHELFTNNSWLSHTTRGHTGIRGNELADRLAVTGRVTASDHATKPKNPKGEMDCGRSPSTSWRRASKEIMRFLSGHSHKCPCGVSKDVRIVGGTEVSPAFRYPWLVALFDSPYLEEPFCGGSIINLRYVVTAAHCLFSWRNKPKPATLFRARVAEHGVDSEEDDLEGVTRMLALESYIVHEGFTEGYFNKDIALLRLEEALDLTSHPEVRPVCLPSDPTKVYEGQTGRVLGWGDTSNGKDKYPGIVREVDIPILECGRKKIAGVLITPPVLCAGLEGGGKDSCYGDSGALSW
ncbi:coagulation factor XII-like [Penaeus chinensis]|uniref:coagulation factor XII-like n=1 Tax=Penaeus chinensis TaxID=139456 RepID=UPI001FB82E63|nr:coagulation factor XII-like [Penaeus chinensis]